MSKTRNRIKRGLVTSRLMRGAATLTRPKVVILIYHSILDRPNSERRTLGRIMHSTEAFRVQMETIARDYHAVSMEDVLLFVRGEKQLPRRAVAITFDDGYLDNYEVAAPILNRTGVPATFYVTVDCIENAKLPWPSRLRYAFYSTRCLQWISAHGSLPLSSESEREKAFLLACDDCARLAGSAQELFVAALESELEIDASHRNDKLMMNWGHVKKLVDQGHIVGSHTMTHPNMAQIPGEQARFELSESKRRIEAALGISVVHFAYPCPALSPHWNKSTVELCRQLGYGVVVTADKGPVYRGDDALTLRRSGPTKNVDGLRWHLECSFLGRTA